MYPSTTSLIKPAAWLAAGLAIAGLAVVVLRVFIYPSAPEWRSYTTDIGEQRQITLPDGSVVDLNTATTLQFKQTQTYRVVELSAGEARFHPAKDAAHPFVVFVGDLAILDVGTQYIVRRRENGAVYVLVIEGEVSLIGRREMQGDLQLPSFQRVPGYQRLRASQQLPAFQRQRPESERADVAITAGHIAAITANGGTTVQPLTPNELERYEAWLDGRVIFDSTPLEEVVSEFNRYNHRKMHAMEGNTAQLSIGGAYNPRDLTGFLSRLEHIDVRYSMPTDGEDAAIELFATPKANRHVQNR